MGKRKRGISLQIYEKLLLDPDKARSLYFLRSLMI